MAIRSPFRVPAHRKFNYVPRHYDPDREELAQRKARIEAEVSAEQREKRDLTNYQENSLLRGGFRSYKEMSDPIENRWRPLLTNFIFAMGIVGTLVMYKMSQGEDWVLLGLPMSLIYFTYRKYIEYGK